MKETLRKAIAGIKPKTIVKLGKIIGGVFYFCDFKHRRIVWANLHFAFPEWTEKQVKDCARKVFQNYVMTFVEVIKLGFCKTKAEVSAVVEFVDYTQKDVDEHLAHGGAINIGAHIGNWEAVLQAGPCKYSMPSTVIVQKLHNKKLNDIVYRFRTRFGVQIIYKRNAVKVMQQVLKEKRYLAMLIDQSKQKNAVPITFFGKTAYSTPAVATLAMRYNVAVRQMVCVRDSGGNLKYHLSKPIEMVRTGHLREDIAANTQRMHDELEKTIRAYPEQWFWFHKRWKYDYPEIYEKGPVFKKTVNI